MIWGLGTGRCGTKSLAKQFKGVHEPPGLTGVLDIHRNLTQILQDLTERAGMDVPLVSDPRHSYVIPEIILVSPSAQFIWLYRDPVSCINSWLARGNWSGGEDDIGVRYAPRGGFPDNWDRVQKGSWFWRSVNSLILENLFGNFEVWKCPDDLTEHENENTPATWASEDAVELSKADRVNIWLDCRYLWEKLEVLRRRTKGRVI